jgi:hypothetical protein
MARAASGEAKNLITARAVSASLKLWRRRRKNETFYFRRQRCHELFGHGQYSLTAGTRLLSRATTANSFAATDRGFYSLPSAIPKRRDKPVVR